MTSMSESVVGSNNDAFETFISGDNKGDCACNDTFNNYIEQVQYLHQ